MREGRVTPELKVMFQEMAGFLVALLFMYTLFMACVALHFTFRFRKWARFELEHEHEVYKKDRAID